jgi:cytoskeletal protein RodZ
MVAQDAASKRLTIILSVGLAVVVGFGVWIAILLGQRGSNQPGTPAPTSVTVETSSRAVGLTSTDRPAESATTGTTQASSIASSPPSTQSSIETTTSVESTGKTTTTSSSMTTTAPSTPVTSPAVTGTESSG